MSARCFQSTSRCFDKKKMPVRELSEFLLLCREHEVKNTTKDVIIHIQDLIKMNDFEWITVVSDVYSTPIYYQDQNESFEHYFTIDHDDGRPIKLLRIDIQDRFYYTILIYLGTNKTIEGTELGDKFTFRFVCPVKQGKYKIVAKGGKYRHSVFILAATTMNLKLEPICQILSPFHMLVSYPIKDRSIYKQVSYRKAGTTDWKTAELSLRKVAFDVDPTSAYEIKLKLVIPGIFETEYTPTLYTTVHQADYFEPDLHFFQTTLLFVVKYRVWLDNIAMTLRYKPSDSDTWIYDARNPPERTRKYKEPKRLIWDIGSKLYDLSMQNNMAIDWQLIIRNTTTNQVADSTVKKLDLHKRDKISRGEVFQRYMVEWRNTSNIKLYTCKDGQFWYRRQKYHSPKHWDYINFKGNFILERKNPRDQKCTITLIPKFKKFENSVAVDQLSLTLLPELIEIILSYVYSPPYSTSNTTLKTIVSLNMVCKNWFNIFAEIGALRLIGELLDDYSKDEYIHGVNSLTFPDWLKFVWKPEYALDDY